ncbi:MAG: hypothetical protein ACTSPI_00835 [Candidatus Heimdallarchaeaceae archaeon]
MKIEREDILEIRTCFKESQALEEKRKIERQGHEVVLKRRNLDFDDPRMPKCLIELIVLKSKKEVKDGY